MMARSELDRRLRQLEQLRVMLRRAEELDDEARVQRIRASIRETEVRVNDVRGERGKGKPPREARGEE